MPITHNSDRLVTRNLTVEDLMALAEETNVEFHEMSAPVTPPAGRVALYAKSDGRLYLKDDAGEERKLGGQTVARVLYSLVVNCASGRSTQLNEIAGSSDRLRCTAIRPRYDADVCVPV